ncbi:MAG TPA: hypothetical protein VGX68_26730 [Thermoanaerobaculia bacterium]|jgi:hypothetical protein|nr:hypothetical protein [Thermoanaerobaculia bacterium]
MPAATFPFRPWVRSTSRRALLWGIAVVVAIGGIVLALGSGERAAWGRAFGVLLAYSLLFWVSLIKIWWTAGRPAVSLDDEAISYQPLHTFRPRRVAFARVLACNPRAGTEALRFVVERNGVARELFLNLAVVKGQHRFLDLLGERLEAAGLERIPGRQNAWRRPGWQEPTGPV